MIAFLVILVLYLFMTRPSAEEFQNYIAQKKNHMANPYAYDNYFLFSRFTDPNEELFGYSTVNKFYIGIGGIIFPLGGEWIR